MRTLLLSILSAVTLVSMNALAGGSGGGGVLAVISNKIGGLQTNPEAIFHIGETDATVKFTYGQFVNGQWQVQKLELPKIDLQGDLQVVKALELSKASKAWTVVR